MIKSLLIMILLSMFVSCDWLPMERRSAEIFKAVLTTSLIETYKVEGSRNEYFNSNKTIERPYYTYQNLIRFTSYSTEGEEAYCLNYQIPLKGKKGNLFFYKVNNVRFSCDNLKQLSQLSVVKGISKLKLFYLLSGRKSKMRKYALKPFELSLLFEKNNESINLKLPLINIRPSQVLVEGKNIDNSGLYLKKKYKSSHERTYLNGAKLIRYIDTYIDKGAFLGNQKDTYSDNSSVQCRSVLKNCDLKAPDECHRCRYGWYEVVDHNCSIGGSRYCGRDRCGERGMPACLKGRSIFKEVNKKSTICYENSPFGYCQDHLRTSCDGNGVLICL